MTTVLRSNRQLSPFRLGGRPGALRRRLLPLAWLLLLAPGAARAEVLAVAPVQDQAGDPALVEVVETAVRREIGTSHRLVEPDALRDALRRGRIRLVDAASAEDLQGLAADTGADWVLSMTLHQSVREDPPRLALSGRAWSLSTGELLWAGFGAPSGLDGRRVLGLGVVHEIDRIAAAAAERLTAELLAAVDGRGPTRFEPSASGLGRVAIVPLDSVAETGGTHAADTATEVVRARLHRHGAEIVPSGCVAGVMRRQGRLVWGGVPTKLRRALQDRCGARHVVTGQVERYETGGPALEPEPRVALALRLVDVADGRILRFAALERSGWDGQTVFGLGRIHTRGALAEHMTATLLRDLLAEEDRSTVEKERNR